MPADGLYRRSPGRSPMPPWSRCPVLGASTPRYASSASGPRSSASGTASSRWRLTTSTGNGVRVRARRCQRLRGHRRTRSADAVQLVAKPRPGRRRSARRRSSNGSSWPTPSHGDAEWTSPHRIDPTTVALGRARWPCSGTGAGASSTARRSITWWPPSWRWPRIATTPSAPWCSPTAGPGPSAGGSVAIGKEGDFESMRTLAPPVGKGWEYV